VPRQTIIVREKTRRERHQDEVTATLIFGTLAAVAGGCTLLIMLIKLMTR
jgi:hypothetical protein